MAPALALLRVKELHIENRGGSGGALIALAAPLRSLGSKYLIGSRLKQGVKAAKGHR